MAASCAAPAAVDAAMAPNCVASAAHRAAPATGCATLLVVLTAAGCHDDSTAGCAAPDADPGTTIAACCATLAVCHAALIA